MAANIFKLYDIRGIYPSELNRDAAYRIGRGFINFLRKKTGKERFTVAVGRDVRPSSSILFKGFSDGIRDEGSAVADLGLVTTPMLYFAVNKFGFNAGAVITASHNPNPFNGIKLTREKAIPLSGEKGIFWIRDFIASGKMKKISKNSRQGKIIKRNIEKDYLDFSLKLNNFKRNSMKSMTLALDAGNGIGGPMALAFLKKLGVKIHPLYCEPDGNFPNHVPDPLIKENLKDLIALVKRKKTDLAVALDGDSDRIVFIDEHGQPVPGDLIIALSAKIILKKNKGAKILYDIRSTDAVAETIKQAGGKPVVSRVGHALIKEKMRKEKILFGGEFAGHYYFGGNLNFEAPFYVLGLILNEIKKSGRSLSKLIEPLKKYYHSGEINFKISDKEKIIKEIKKRYRGGRISELDGVRIDLKDWWFLVRPSNTEPVLRLVIEAKTKELYEQKKAELIKLISGSQK